MSEQEIDRSLLGGYALGVLDPAERRLVETHLVTCASCRLEVAELGEVTETLGSVPPEAFLEGPPPGGDLLLQRTLRQMRAEREPVTGARGRGAALAAAAVVALVVALTVGVLVGRNTAPQQTAAPTPAGTRVLTGADPATGARMTVTVIPAAGWVRLQADVTGVRAGTRCQLVVHSKDADAQIGGSWVVSEKGEQSGTSVGGSAVVAPDQVADVEVQTLTGVHLVTAPA